MNFEHLRTIIKNIKQQMTCTQCKANYMNEDIHIMGVQKEQGIIALQCHECKTPIVITASLATGKISPSSKEDVISSLVQLRDIPEYREELGEIEVDDVVEMHEYLKDFSGNFAQLFGEEK